MKNISILIKPASQACNMDCKYCFYHDIADGRTTHDFGFMRENTYKKMIDEAYKYVDGGRINFAFQGGEPTLVGIEFYYKFSEYVDSINLNNTKITYAIQTNGILINDKFCEYFKKYNYLVGLSIDGDRKMNDINRIDWQKNGTHIKTMRASKLFKLHKIPFNILTVINNDNVKKIDELYKFYDKHDFKHIQFIPCLDALEEDPFSNEYSLSPTDYANFLIESFDKYYNLLINDKFISERFFDNILGMYLKVEPESCMQRGYCSIQFVVEGNGNTFPCDFYAYDEFSIGNINSSSFDEMIMHPIARDFISTSINFDPKCSTCKFKNVCRGGCKRFKQTNVDGELLNIYCESYYEFFTYSHEKFLKLATKIKSGRV